jgi:hypothetical protein
MALCVCILPAPEYGDGERMSGSWVGETAVSRVCHPWDEMSGAAVCVKPAGMGVMRFFWLPGVGLRNR